RRLLGWVREAGFPDHSVSTSTWCFADPEMREFWGGSWADRITRSGVARDAVELGFATTDELERLAAAWRTWAASEDGIFTVVHTEVLARR
ncbi:MAG TPA: SAM-dependent methyltransferase, partial [Micrococcales bacterium]|nr:SAM-dependent methyltransferase [Micrococcales bacterium]